MIFWSKLKNEILDRGEGLRLRRRGLEGKNGAGHGPGPFPFVAANRCPCVRVGLNTVRSLSSPHTFLESPLHASAAVAA